MIISSMNIGKKIKKFREAKKLSLRAMGERMNGGEHYFKLIHQWERGLRIPGLGSLRKIAKALGISVKKLVEG